MHDRTEPMVAADPVAAKVDLSREAAALKGHTQRQSVGDGDRVKLPTPQMDWKFFTPLIWAPIFPFIRHSTKNLQPNTRYALIGTAILIANLHGFWLINNPDLSDEALGPAERSLRR